MKKLIILGGASFLLFGCFGIKQVGDLNMVANRNVNPNQEYELVKTYAGSDSKKALKKEFKKVKAETIQAAIDYTIKNTAGGEFLTNAKIYLLNGTYFVVHGDVWGAKDVEKQFKGWKVGDRVQWKELTNVKKGTIVDLKNAEEASIKEDETGKVKNIKYEKLQKDF